jgi:putative transposase
MNVGHREWSFQKERIGGSLKQHEAGEKTADVCRKHGISAATIYRWKKKFRKTDVAEARRLENEDHLLELLVAIPSLDSEATVSRPDTFNASEAAVLPYLHQRICAPVRDAGHFAESPYYYSIIAEKHLFDRTTEPLDAEPDLWLTRY